MTPRALLFGDVDAKPDDAAVAGAPLLDQDGVPVSQLLLVASIRVEEFVQPRRHPLFFAAERLRIVAALDADSQRVGQPGTGLEQMGAALVDVDVLLVPKDVAPFGVEEHNAFRKNVDGIAQPRGGFPRFQNRDCGLGFSAPGVRVACEASPQ